MPALVVLVALVLVASADAANGLRFTSAPARVVQGNQAKVSIAVRPTKGLCTLTVRYADGSRQGGIRAASAVRGRATWSWRVPEAAKPGRALLTAWCARSGKITRGLTVVGTIVPARIEIANQGFSQRIRGRSNYLSYGIVLANSSPDQDALDVYVLVNFIDPTGRVVQSATRRVAAVPASGSYNLAAATGLPTGIIVDRLELVVKVGSRAPRSVRRPAVGDVRIVPSPSDGGYVASVDGFVVNDHPTLEVTGARLSIVLLDASGAVVGGALGSVGALLPPGARVFFSARSGVNAVPVERAVTALISIDAGYRQPT